MIEDDDVEAFFSEMDDVNVLHQDKITRTTDLNKLTKSNKYRQKAAVYQADQYQNFLTDGDIDLVNPLDVLSYKLDGIQPNVFKNLKNASYQFDFHIDLHGMTVKEAREQIFQLFNTADVEDSRCFLITHGKGERSVNPAKLKSYVNHWLRQIDQVIAFHSALPRHGGVGSTYVLLKKPKNQRKVNQVKYE